MLSNVSPSRLLGPVDVAMMRRLDDPVFIGGVGLGMIVFNLIYFGLGFLRMGTPVLLPKCMALVRMIKLPFYRLAA